MKIIKPGGHRLFGCDAETSETVARMLLDLEKNGMDAVRKYSKRYDQWDPASSFRLDEEEIKRAISEVSDQAVRDTEYCQANVRAFAQAQLKTLQPLNFELRP